MITIVVQRRNQNSICTTGLFKTVSSRNEGLVTGYTLELPWKDNQRNISCIPAGRYNAYIRPKEESKWGYDVIQLIDVPNRNAIQFHAGNHPRDTKGCTLVGTRQGKNVVWESRKKLAELIGFIKTDIKLTGDEKFNVIVKDVV